MEKDLTGRYLKVIDDSRIYHYPCKKGDYLKFVGISSNGIEFWGAYTSTYAQDNTDNSRYYGTKAHTMHYFELMPEGFNPNDMEKTKKTKKVEDLVYPDVIHLESQEQLDKILKYNKRLYKYFKPSESYMLFGGLDCNSGNGISSKPYNEPQYNNYEFSDIIFSEEKEESKFEVGKWYYFESYENRNPNYAKCLIYERGYFNTKEWINKRVNSFNGSGGWDKNQMHNIRLLTDLSEIQQYLPDNHVDKIINKQETPKQINYKELQNKAWEIYKDVKIGDRYIDTRGDEHIATKNAFKIGADSYDIHNEYSWYIDCGPGFLWEIKDGKELFATLLPKEEIKPEKWIPKVGDWVVSLVNRPDYRKEGDVFQVLEVDNNCLYYKKHVNGDIETFRPAKPHEILKTHEYLIEDINETCNQLYNYPLTPKQAFKPTIKSNTQEEIKIQIKKSKTIKI